MNAPCDWPALAGAEALVDEPLHYEIGIWGKVHGLASDYRWIARSSGFGARLPDLHRYLRLGGEDLPVRTAAWRAPWSEFHSELAGQDWFAIGTYPSRAQDAFGRSGVLEKQVLHWLRPSPGFPAALAACALLPLLTHADDRLWWGQVGAAPRPRLDAVMPLGPDTCPAVALGHSGLAAAIATGIDDLLAVLDQSRLAGAYAALLAGVRPVMLGGLDRPLSPFALAALLLPLPAELAGRCSVCAWMPSILIDPLDLGHNWDLAVTRQPWPIPPVTAEFADRGALLAAALRARDPGLIRPTQGPGPIRHGVLTAPAGSLSDNIIGSQIPRVGSETSVHCASTPYAIVEQSQPCMHPNPRMHLEPAAAASRPGLGYLYEFADRINLRRLDLARLALDLSKPAVYPLLGPERDPAGHPLIGWIAAQERHLPPGVDAAEWAFKIDQLRAAALILLPHPATLDLVGLPGDPRVPALLAVLALEPARVAIHLMAHGGPALCRMLEHSLSCPIPSLVVDIRAWMQRWLVLSGSVASAPALGDLLSRSQPQSHP